MVCLASASSRPSDVRSSQNRSFPVAAVIWEKNEELFLHVRRLRDKKAGMLLLSSDLLRRLLKPGDSGSALTSVSDARHCWCHQRGRRHPYFPLLSGNYDGKVFA
jgi:hypothetical protein